MPITQDFEQTIEIFQQVAVDSFNQAHDALAHPPEPQLGSDDYARKHAAWEAGIAKAKAQMTSSLQQLAQADIMLSESKGRESYRILAALIVSTNAALSTLVDTTDGTPAEQQARAQLLSAHAALLQALASIAPLATWQSTRSPGGGNG